MKIVVFFVKDLFERGGIPNVVSQVANLLNKSEQYQIIIISLFKSNNDVAYHLDEDICVYTLNKQHFNLKLYYFRCLKQLRKILKEINPNIFITSGIGYFYLTYHAYKKAHLKKCKLIAWEHSCFGDWKIGGLAWMGYKSIKYYDELVVLTNINLLKYREKFPKLSINKIYNPLDIQFTKVEYDLDSKILISVGDLIYRKGFDLIPKIAIEFLNSYKDWKWYIYGSGMERKNIQSQINKLGLSNNVILKGYSCNINNIMSKASIYICTSRSEAFGMVVVEAQNCGLPVISFEAQGPCELVIDGVNGYIVKQGDYIAMQDAIHSLIDNPSLRFNMSKHSKDLFDNFSNEKLSKMWEEVIDE